GAMVTDRYQHELHHPSVADLVAWAGGAPRADGGRGIPLLGVDNLPGSVALETYPLPRECVLVLGQEGPGLSQDVRDAAEAVLHITQFGSTRSINAGAAAAIAMHSWVRQHADLTSVEPMEPTP
ncbi:MAG: RNA methyltransferase, partial [Actinomycetota bacterium]|nr:RNA methyltransferase [Actinomycetota bacterium]